MTSSSLVAPSSLSTASGTTFSALTLLASPLPLAQCTGLEIGEHSKGETSFIADAMIAWSKEPSSIESYLEEALFEELCDDT